MGLQPLKICPKCLESAPLDVSVCARCARRFRTQFFLPPEQAAASPDPPQLLSLAPAAKTALLPPARSFALPLTTIEYPEGKQQTRPARPKRLVPAALLAVAAAGLVLFLILWAFVSLQSIRNKNTPGHLVSTQDAESLMPYCSPHQVRETLGEPVQIAHGTWSYPTSEGTVVSVTFFQTSGIQRVDKIAVLDDSGGVLWQRNR